MKRNIIMIILSISAGIIITFFVLNKENIYAKEKYVVYALEVGSYSNISEANEKVKTLNMGIVLKDNDLYKVYVALYKDLDIVNKMVSIMENKNLDIYISTINVSKKFYEILDNYEKLVMNTNDENVLNKINASILKLYLESGQK